jgi:hypothetical protein
MNTRKNPMNLDAGESAFFKRELEYVKSKSYDAKLKQLKGLMILPISTEANAGATQITFRAYKGVGFAKIIADYAKDFPRVDVYGEEKTVKIHGIGDSYGYSIKEIRESQFSGKRLDVRRSETAKRAIEEKLNSISLLGDAATGLYGLINYPGITNYTVLNDGTSSSKTWAAKTPDQIVRDVVGMVNAVMTPTSGREVPDTLLLPMAQYNDIATRRMGTASDITVLEYILKTSPAIKKVEWLLELTGAGASTTDRMMVLSNDANNITFEMPQPFEQFDAQQEGMEFKVPCHAETAGVIVYYPLSIAYGDGI